MGKPRGALLRGQRKGASRGLGGSRVSFSFWTKYPMNNEYFGLEALHFQLGQSAQCARAGNFEPCSAGGEVSWEAAGGHCPG